MLSGAKISILFRISKAFLFLVRIGVRNTNPWQSQFQALKSTIPKAGCSFLRVELILLPYFPGCCAAGMPHLLIFFVRFRSRKVRFRTGSRRLESCKSLVCGWLRFVARNLKEILEKKRDMRLMNVYAIINKCVAGWCGLWLASPLAAQSVRMAVSWGLEDVVALACQSSPDAQAARHTFRSAYWDYRSYRANYLPSLTLTSNPGLDRAINQVTMDDGAVRFVEQNYLNTDLSLSLQQNIAWTGGTLSLQTSLQRMDLLSDKTFSWKSVPVNVAYSQSLFGYNSLKWNRRIYPLRYEEARRAYLETLELVAAAAVDKFFAFVLAQSDYRTACQNYAQADTLYRFAQGRYRIGTTTENEMLQLEINLLNEETNRMDARIAMKECALDLRSYLGLSDGDSLPDIRVSDGLPDVVVHEGEALQWAHVHSPDITSLQRRRMEAESNVAQAKANAGLKASLYLRFGLTQASDRFSEVYRDPSRQQAVSVGITLPILDWGRGRGQVRVARSQRDLVETQVEQSLTDFDQNVRKLVGQFNLQAMRVRVAARTDSTALRRSEVARRLYLLGRSSVLDLNASIEEKDAARRSYLNALHTYWSLYYTLRSLTLYDFRAGRPLQADYEGLIE